MVGWTAVNAIALLRVSLGIVFVWFGALKFAPGFSPAEGLAGATMAKLTFGLVDPKLAIAILAVWETAVGLALIAGIHLRIALALLLLQMAGTLTPLALFPEITFTRFPLVPTMEGQYILKNLVLISAAIVIGATLRGEKGSGGCCGGAGPCPQAGGPFSR
ncbi:MAG: DoxX family membrane protein [Deltaproteobacteria bacterium]